MITRALLVGINAYPGQPLNGCVNDVKDMAQFLVESCDFQTSDIRLLVDGRATTKNIKARLDWLVSDVKPGDRVFFHYSGHGTQFPMRNAAGNVSAVHDAICPVDFDWSREHALIDDDLRAAFDVVPEGIEFIFVSDSCNSGDLTRALRTHAVRFLVPPADIEWRLKTARAKRLGVTPLQHDRCGLISGCRSDQESADAVFNGRANGALTFFLLQTLKTAGEPPKPLVRLVPDVVRALKHNGYDQQPQLRGPNEIKRRSFLEASGGRGDGAGAKRSKRTKKK